uniref:hybrid sensor histidine kinase/response regulator n=1 Tax=Spongiibacter sp. TaxID=2024860 RepID=UPI0035670F74
HQYQLLKYQSLLAGALSLGMSILACIIFFGYINNNISRDLHTLQTAIRRLINGQRDMHIHMPGNDEFSDLAEALNQLNATQVRELKELQLNLEQSNSDLRETLETLEIQNIELDLARREAVTASRVKSEFLANTSHEIRTPLNSILGFSNILLKADIHGRQRDAVETIRNSAVNLLTIINDILDFSKLEAGKLVFDKTPVQLRELAEDTLIMLAPGAAEKNLDLALFIQSGTPSSIFGDSLRLRQMLTNLLSNAIKFTPSGYVRLDILCNDCDGEYANLTFRVSDSGIGISSEQRRQIFRDFGQADASVTRQYGGTGLGLVIVQGLAKEMGGEVGVDSELGRGSTFWFSLRLAVDNNAMQLRDFDALKGRSVALYDRSQLYSLSLCELLESWGVRVIHSRNLRDIDQDCDYSIISLDSEETTQLLPACQGEHPSIILSPHADASRADDGRIWLNKPVSHVRLFDALSKGTSANADKPLDNFRNHQLLIVDDNPSNLLILKSFLEDFGIMPTSAQNGVEAVSYCLDQRFDLILIDIQMPQLDGIAASRQIRQRGKNQHTPIIAISAYLAPEDPAQLRDAGIDEYLSKPVNEAQLASMLTRFLTPSSEQATAEGSESLLQPPSEDSIPRPVDLHQCLTLSKQRPKLAQSMLEMLLAELPELREKLCHAHQTQNWSELAELNHGLKGNCCYTGVPALKQAVIALEVELKQQPAANSETFQTLLAHIDELLEWQHQHELEVLFG